MNNNFTEISIKENASLALQIAEEGIILLKNNGALPLNKNDIVVGVGYEQDKTLIYGGDGSGWVNSKNKVSYYEGLINAKNNLLIKDYYRIDYSQIVEADKVIYFINRSSTEGEDNPLVSNNYLENKLEIGYYLNNREKNEILELIKNYGSDKVIIVLNVRSVIDTTWLLEQNVSAIVCAYYAGDYSGTSLANILTNQVSPSGKTVDTWAKDINYYPSKNYPSDRTSYYEEDIFVGYRYFQTFDPEYKNVNFEFGFGLSYTTFSIITKNIKTNSNIFSFEVEVTNNGKYLGKEVVQIYLNAPQGKLGKPALELVGYAKTKNLKPNEKEILVISINLNDFSSFDDSNQFYILEKGNYNFYIGNSIKNAKENNIQYTFSLSEDKIIEYAKAHFPPTKLTKRLLSNGSYQKLNPTDFDKKEHTIPLCGSQIIQAEEYYTSSSTKITSETYYVGIKKGMGLGNLHKLNQFVDYKIICQKNEEYNIAFNIASIKDVEDIFSLYVNNIKQNIIVNTPKTHSENDGLWFKCNYFSSPNFKLKLQKGENIIRFKGNEDKFQNFDSFILYNKNISNKDLTLIQAETYDEAKGVMQVSHPNGSSVKITNTDNYLSYYLNSLEKGEYYLSINASNLLKTSDNAVSVFINNKEIGSLKLNQTASKTSYMLESNYFIFENTSDIKLNLPKGEFTLTLKANTLENQMFVSHINSIKLIPSKIYKKESQNPQKEIKVNNNLNGNIKENLITFVDVCKNPNLIDKFLEQLSIEELVHLLGLDKEQNNAGTGVGGFGGRFIDSKYQIPFINTSDGPAGIRFDDKTKYATWFPSMTLLASTWNKELPYKYGQAVGQEANNGNIQIWLAPGLNIHRNPLCGRNFEYMSEDPLVTAINGTQITRGAQSVGIQVCIKHFAVNSQETNRFSNDAQVSERALREIYLKAFKLTIRDGNPLSLMSSYNQINGEYPASNKEFMTKFLIDECHFNGCSVTDWTASMPHTYLVLSGNNIKSFNPNYHELIAAYQNCLISREQLVNNAKIVLKTIMRSSIIKK